MPRVSVIVPNYNHARFLAQRLTSVLGQTYQDLEVVYLDDASTDDSQAVFERFAGCGRIRALRNETNSGSPFAQWNKGVGEATGEYVWIAESDDFADPRFLEALVARLDAHPRVGVAYCRSWVVDEAGMRHGLHRSWIRGVPHSRWSADYVVDGREECWRHLLQKATIHNASGAVLRRAAYLEAGGADPSLRLSGDWLTWIKIALARDVAYVAEPLNYHRYHAQTVRSRTRRSGLKVHEEYRVLRYVLDHADVPREALDAALDARAFSLLVSRVSARVGALRGSDPDWERAWAIARETDPALGRRLLRMATLGVCGKLWDRCVR